MNVWDLLAEAMQNVLTQEDPTYARVAKDTKATEFFAQVILKISTDSQLNTTRLD
jgi:prephenate dehydratase